MSTAILEAPVPTAAPSTDEMMSDYFSLLWEKAKLIAEQAGLSFKPDLSGSDKGKLNLLADVLKRKELRSADEQAASEVMKHIREVGTDPIPARDLNADEQKQLADERKAAHETLKWATVEEQCEPVNQHNRRRAMAQQSLLNGEQATARKNEIDHVLKSTLRKADGIAMDAFTKAEKKLKLAEAAPRMRHILREYPEYARISGLTIEAAAPERKGRKT